MKENKLFKVVGSLNGHERKMADKFLRSCYFNENELLLKLFRGISKQKNKNKEEVWKKLFPRKKYDDLKFRRVCSDLEKLLEKFLSLRRFQKDEVAVQLNWIKTVNERKLTSLFSYSSQIAGNKLEQKKFLSADYFLHRYQLEEQLYHHYENLNRRSTEKNLLETVGHLDHFYFISKLQYACLILHYSDMVNYEKEIPMLNELLNYLERHGEEKNPVVNNYFLVLKMLQQPADESFFLELKKSLSEQGGEEKRIPRKMLRELFLYAINYGVRKINYGELNYLREVFDLYLVMLRKKLLFSGKYLSQWDYKNLVVTALRLGEFKWTERFIEQNKIYLPNEDRVNAVRYNQAKLAFYKNDHERVLKLLQTVEYNDPFYILDSKSMLLKSFYELDERESLQSLCNSFSILLRRKKLISETHRVNHLNFIRFIKMLTRINGKEKEKINQLKKQLETATQLADKGWLLEKINKLT